MNPRQRQAQEIVSRLIQAGRSAEAQELTEAFNLRDSLRRNHLDPLEVKEGFADVDPQEIEQSLPEIQRFIPASVLAGSDLTVPREKFAPPTFPPRQGGIGGPYPPSNRRGTPKRAKGVFPGMPDQLPWVKVR